MTDTVTTALESHESITSADSWPTGTENAGPDEYGICYDADETTPDTVLDALETAVIDAHGIGFHIAADTDPNDTEYDLIATVHFHPLADGLSDFFDSHETVTAYGLDWEPEDVWARYDDSPSLNLVAPGTLAAWFETENTDYDAVLNALETYIPDWESKHYYNIDLEVYSADSDHCHIGLVAATHDEDFDEFLRTCDLSPSPVTNPAGQKEATVYTAEWLPYDVYITRDGIAHLGDTYHGTDYDPNDPSDVVAFREDIARYHVEHPTSNNDRETDDLTRAVVADLQSTHGISAVEGWLGEQVGQAYGIDFDQDVRSRDDVLELVEALVTSNDPDADYFPATVRDYTDYYHDEDYDLVAGVTFQLS